MHEEKKIKRLNREFEKEKQGLQNTRVFWKGSITKRWVTCGNPACGCKTDEDKRHGPYYWWTTKEKGRTKAVLIPKEFLDDAESYLKNARELKKKIQRLSQLSCEIVEIKLKFAQMRKAGKP